MTTRRAFLGAAAAPWARSETIGDRLFGDVKKYSELGEHRTASFGDRNTGVWLASELKRGGVEAERVPFKLDQFFLHECELKLGGTKIDAFPLWYPRETRGAGVIGHDVAVIEFPMTGAAVTARSGHAELITKAAAAGAKAVLGYTKHPSGDILALNAQRGPEAWPVPVLLVGARDVPGFRDGERVEFRTVGPYHQATAHEVVGTYGRSGPQIVLSTPYSGWFRCAGERGPGVALWLHAARWVAARQPKARYLFVASSGHELDGIGVRSFLENHAPKPSEVACWMHLGAGIATYDWVENRPTKRPYRGIRLMASHPNLMPLLSSNFRTVPFLEPKLTEAGSAVGELVLFIERGYRAFGFAGAHYLHHLAADVPDTTTGPELLAPVAHAIEQTLAAVEKGA